MSFLHVEPTALPLALRDLHLRTRVGATVRVDVAGRVFRGPSPSGRPDLLEAVFVGAGFATEEVVVDDGRGVDRVEVTARRERTLADTVGPGMRLLLVGLNPSLVAADAGVGFHSPGNRAWPALLRAGLASVDRDPLDLLRRHHVGMTDLVKRASARADVLTTEELVAGVERIDLVCAWLRPAAVCVLGLTGWRRAVDRGATTGLQKHLLGGRPVYLMPNPSGANAHVSPADLVEHLRAAADVADGHPVPRDSPGAPA